MTNAHFELNLLVDVACSSIKLEFFLPLRGLGKMSLSCLLGHKLRMFYLQSKRSTLIRNSLSVAETSIYSM